VTPFQFLIKILLANTTSALIPAYGPKPPTEAGSALEGSTAGWQRRVYVFSLAEWLDAAMVPVTRCRLVQSLWEESASLSFCR
jgi:hypothetical protein